MKGFKKVFVLVLVLTFMFAFTVNINAADPVNYAKTATVSASTEFPEGQTYVAGNAIDGKKETCWAPHWEDIPWIQLDLTKDVMVSKLVLVGRNTQTADREYDYIDELDISFDGKVVKTISDYPRQSYETPVVVTFDTPIKAKSILLQVTAGKANPGFSEIEVYGSDSTGSTAQPSQPAQTSQATNKPTDSSGGKTPATGDAGTLFPMLIAAAAAFGGLKLKKK